MKTASDHPWKDGNPYNGFNSRRNYVYCAGYSIHGSLVFARDRKKDLIGRAEAGFPRPGANTSLGEALTRYTTGDPKRQDPVFNFKIRRIAPHWFQTSADVRKKQQEELLALAALGGPRPKSLSLLERRLAKFVTNCPEFFSKIYAVASHWFPKKTVPPERHVKV